MLRHWTIGLVVGLVFGVALLVTGVIGAALGIVAVALLLAQRPRMAVIGGLCVGIGASLVILLLRADLACRQDCVGPELTAWYAAAAVVTLLGLGASLALFCRVRSGA